MRMVRSLILFFIFSIIFHCAAQANEKEFYFNQVTSDWLDRQAHNLDMSLSGARYTKKEEDSQAIIANEIYFREGEGVKFRPSIDLRLSLPNFEKKYKLMFSNYNRNKIRRSNYGRREFLDNQRSDYGATLSFAEKIGDFDITFEPRIQIEDPIATFYTLRFESEARQKANKFLTRFEFFADSEKGTGQFASLIYRRTFWGNWGHSVILEEEYQDAQNLFTTLQGYTLHYQINEAILLDNSLIFRSRSEPVNFHLDEISVGPSFTHEILKDELRYSINYFHFFNEAFNFKGRSTGSVILEFIF